MKHVHRVGNGMQVGKGRLQRQWYALWGIVPLNRVDTHELAQGAKDYEITTFYSPIDLVLNFFTGIFSVYSRTVVVVR
ncbi:MAG: hypothetical protein D6805_00515 [Planctomycetota bacterium]|nr:MAG: hypothetical protein D6805_00515 [Planctomycetota bacterium]